MKFWFCIITFLINVVYGLNAQESINRHSILFHTGLALDDGFVYTNNNLPTIGLGYSYKLNKTFSIDASLFSVYKKLGDPTVFGWEAFNIITRNSNSLFISQADRDKITNVGIKDLNSDGHVKFLHVPLSVSLNIHPLRIGRSTLGFAIGATATYGSYKASRDEFTMNITLKDGTVYENLTFKQEIESRNLVIGGSYSKLYYRYDLSKKNAIQLSMHSLDFFWSYKNILGHHLLTLDFHSSF
jgi:hypothetical protein